MSEIVAIIPARGGSKGIKKKNIRIFDGKPLIYYQIKAAQDSKYITSIIVSTDDDEIEKIVKQYEKVEVIKRPQDIADDLSKSEDALIHAVEQLEKQCRNIELVVFLQATSPLTKTSYIDDSIEKIFNGCDSVCSAIEDYGFFIDEKETLIRPMRQNKIPKIRECGNCWVIKKDVLLKERNRLAGNVGYNLIDRWDALEIDEPEDIPIIKAILTQRNRQENNTYFRKRYENTNPEYEENYWGKTIDPDGKVRNKQQEKELFLQDASSIVTYINSLEPGKILDVGCGFGFLLSAINDKWVKFGTEISGYASEVAQEYGEIYLGELVNTNYSSEEFDVVNLYHVIEHLIDPKIYVNIINDLLKVGGKFIITTPDFESITAERFKDKFRLLHDQTHISLFSTQSLINLLVDNGFEIEKVEFPFFESRYFTEENLMRLFETDKMSPPFYGNIVTVYAYKC
ncbi:MAG: methyltransferase domain-containing protein [Vampirovibrionia bacterium]